METTAEDCISPHCRDMILLLSVGLVGFLLHGKTQRERKWKGVGGAPKAEEVLELKYLLFFGCCIMTMALAGSQAAKEQLAQSHILSPQKQVFRFCQKDHLHSYSFFGT